MKLIARIDKAVHATPRVINKPEVERLLAEAHEMFSIPLLPIYWKKDITFPEKKIIGYVPRVVTLAEQEISSSRAKESLSAEIMIELIRESVRWNLPGLDARTKIQPDYWLMPLLKQVTYLKNFKGNWHDHRVLAILRLFFEMYENGLGFWQEINLALYLTPAPTIRRDKEHRIHSDQLPALEWEEGQKVYFLHGVIFSEALWREVVSRKMPFEKILAIKNIEQRTQAMRYADIGEFLRNTHAKLISESARGNKLWKTLSTSVFQSEAYFVSYSCPSTGRLYVSGVPEEVGKMQDADAAIAWKHWMDKDTYLSMTAES